MMRVAGWSAVFSTCTSLLQSLNTGPPDDLSGQRRVLEALLGSLGDPTELRPPLSCDGGANLRIGAGAVVTRDVPPGVVAVGNPARIVRRVE